MTPAERSRSWRERHPGAGNAAKKRWSDRHPGRAWEVVQRYRQKYPERYKQQRVKDRRKANYGITDDMFQGLLAAQNYCCAACGTAEWGKGGPQVDHNHETSTVRGLLCRGCNSALGHVGDDIGRIIQLVHYLSTSGA